MCTPGVKELRDCEFTMLKSAGGVNGVQGSTLTVVLNRSYRPSKHLGTIFVNKFPLKKVPNVFETNENEINKNKCCLWMLCNVFSFYINEKLVGPVKILQDQ